ncbi:hypothetical protein K1T71_014809 [Dendrolimus kikuchii]|nr:hypothetical protein K1T71_014809 [Dendrolimus kikuchii]
MTEAIRSITVANELTDSHFSILQKETSRDETLQTLKRYTNKGWPTDTHKINSKVKPYWKYRNELTEACGLLWRGNRVIIPKTLQSEMLNKLHFAHLGFEKCLLRAKELLFWPELNNQLKNLIMNCQTCLTYRKNNIKEKLCPHDIPKEPWSKVGVDLFYFKGINYILIVDYYSKFIEVIELTSTISESVIKHLKCTFSRLGIPQTLVSDCGPQFISKEFRDFAQKWCFQHVTSSPRYPQSNGQAERSVQTVKNILKKSLHSKTDFRLALLEYLNTPINDKLPSPAELLFTRKLRTIFPIINQFKQSHYNPVNAKNLSMLTIGQTVKVRDEIKKMWKSGVITKYLGNRKYEIRLQTGRTIVRNRRHLIVDSPHLQPYRTTYDIDYDDFNPFQSNESGMSSDTAPNRHSPCESNNNNNNGTSDYYITRFGRTVRPPDRWRL